MTFTVVIIRIRYEARYKNSIATDVQPDQITTLTIALTKYIKNTMLKNKLKTSLILHAVTELVDLA